MILCSCYRPRIRLSSSGSVTLKKSAYCNLATDYATSCSVYARGPMGPANLSLQPSNYNTSSSDMENRLSDLEVAQVLLALRDLLNYGVTLISPRAIKYGLPSIVIAGTIRPLSGCPVTKSKTEAGYTKRSLQLIHR